MAAKQIYFCGSIRGGRSDRDIYLKLIDHLKKYGTVLTEHVASVNVTEKGEAMSEKEIHDRDVEWLQKSDVVVAEVTTPSLGVGYEIGRAVTMNKKILCLFQAESNRSLSAMIQGAEAETFQVFHYHNVEEGRAQITTFLESLG